MRTVDGTDYLAQQPVEELQQLRGDAVQLSGRAIEPGAASLQEEGVSGQTLEIVAEFEPQTADTVGLVVRSGGEEETVVGYDAVNRTVFVDRSTAGEADFHEGFASRNAAPLPLLDGRVKLHVFVDRSSVEVFANDGLRTLTHRIFPDSASSGVSLMARGGEAQLVELTTWPLKSVWSDA